jgi:hypothetical protein
MGYGGLGGRARGISAGTPRLHNPYTKHIIAWFFDFSMQTLYVILPPVPYGFDVI